MRGRTGADCWHCGRYQVRGSAERDPTNVLRSLSAKEPFQPNDVRNSNGNGTFQRIKRSSESRRIAGPGATVDRRAHARATDRNKLIYRADVSAVDDHLWPNGVGARE